MSRKIEVIAIFLGILENFFGNFALAESKISIHKFSGWNNIWMAVTRILSEK